VKLPAYLHVIARLRMRGTIPLLPHTSSWRGVRLRFIFTDPLLVNSGRAMSGELYNHLELLLVGSYNISCPLFE
jgi:hypothetical protein